MPAISESSAPMVSSESTSFRETPGMSSIILGAFAASLAGLLFGYDTGVASGIQGYLQDYFKLSNGELGFAIASLDIGCVVGAAGAGYLTDRFGRKRLLIFCALLFVVSGILSAIPRNMSELVFARMLGGLAVGASSMIAPIYIAEIAPEKHRGRLASLFQVGIVLGIAMVYWVNYFIMQYGSHYKGAAHNMLADWNQTYGWRWMLGSEALPAIVFLLMLVFVKESPRWLIMNGREEEARDILQRFSGPERANREIDAVKEVAAQEEGQFSELFSRRYRVPLIVALFLALFSQFSGINSIIYYAPRVFGAAGMNTSRAFGSTALVGMVLLVFTFVATAFVDKVGRKGLLAIGTAIQVISLISVGWVFAVASRESGFEANGQLVFQGHMTHETLTALAAKSHATVALMPHFSQSQVMILLVSVLVFIAAFAMALGPIPWIIIAEIFPARVRGRASSVGVMMLWLGILIIAYTFPIEKDAIGLAATYFIYAACSLITCLFAVFVLPETKGRTLEEIETGWRQQA